MKIKNHFGRSYGVLALLILGTLSFSACTENKASTQDQKIIAEESSDAGSDNVMNEKDSEFLKKATEINLQEIELGILAQQNSKMLIVKELADMLVKDHRQALSELKGLAAHKKITIPGSISQTGKDNYEILSKKTGGDFDIEYCAMMVAEHKDAISLFEKASEESADKDIKLWAKTMLPVLKKHLDHSVACQEKCKKMIM